MIPAMTGETTYSGVRSRMPEKEWGVPSHAKNAVPPGSKPPPPPLPQSVDELCAADVLLSLTPAPPAPPATRNQKVHRTSQHSSTRPINAYVSPSPSLSTWSARLSPASSPWRGDATTSAAFASPLLYQERGTHVQHMRHGPYSSEYDYRYHLQVQQRSQYPLSHHHHRHHHHQYPHDHQIMHPYDQRDRWLHQNRRLQSDLTDHVGLCAPRSPRRFVSSDDSEDGNADAQDVLQPPQSSLISGTGDSNLDIFGSVSLSLSEDEDVLSPLHCFMRRFCVEAFSATPEDVSTPRYGKSHGVKVVVGQVGIRCLYCKHLAPGNRPERAVCYPSSLRNIYHSIETWQRRHSLVCKDISPWIKNNLAELMRTSKARAGGRRKYWEDSAARLGMVDTPQGIRFSRPPGALMPSPRDRPESQQGQAESAERGEPVVEDSDRNLVTDFLFVLMDQMETCKFTEEDRSGGRSKVKDNEVGFPGMQCKHCLGKAGFGRYFPSSIHALALANSDRNIYNHIQKCRRCPAHVKEELMELSKLQSQSKNRRGLRKLFFFRVWGRMHGAEPDSDEQTESAV